MKPTYALGALLAVCAAYPALAVPLSIAGLMVQASNRYGQRLKAQMARESDPIVLRPFVQRSDVPKVGWIVPYPVLLVAGSVIVGLTTLAFSGLTRIIFWAAGWSSYLPLEEAPIGALLTVLCGWYGLLVLVVETINKHVMKGRVFRSYKELVM
jgi:hypothetical protein